MKILNQIRSLKKILILITANILFLVSCSDQVSINQRFQSELDNIQKKYKLPGITASFVLADGTVEEFASGMADIEKNIPMTSQSRMLAASIGKTFVSAVILALANDSILTLDDPLSKWLGNESWFKRLPNHKSVTIRQLLNHTSGIPNHVESELFADAFKKDWQNVTSTFAPEELISFVLDTPPLFEAGKGWSYTDTGYLLLGLIIEKATNNSWYDEVIKRYIKPLGLSRTSPSNQTNLKNLAAGYMSENNPFSLPPKTTSEPGQMIWNPAIESSGGGFISNSRDLAVWGKELYEGRVLEKDYLNDLLASVPVSENHTYPKYGLGVAIHYDSLFGHNYGHNGWIPGYVSSLRYYSDLGIAIAFQINTDIDLLGGPEQIVENIELRLIKILDAYKN